MATAPRLDFGPNLSPASLISMAGVRFRRGHLVEIPARTCMSVRLYVLFPDFPETGVFAVYREKENRARKADGC